VAAVEDDPDGNFDDPKLHAAIVASSRREHEFGDEPAYWAAKYLGRGFYKVSAFDCAFIVATKVVSMAGHEQSRRAEAERLASRLRDIFGHPFRPPPQIDPARLSWNGGTVPELARTIVEQSDYGLMPILADALEEAGVTDEEILQHCRQAGDHVRGCWVVDLILGKE
jgi:hypothetical protein